MQASLCEHPPTHPTTPSASPDSALALMESRRNMSKGGLSLGGELMKRSFRMRPVPWASNACACVGASGQVGIQGAGRPVMSIWAAWRAKGCAAALMVGAWHGMSTGMGAKSTYGGRAGL